jgi:lysophospholipase L1-like esterase
MLAIDTLQREYPERVDYFPSYEIMMDELRDYRYYAEDGLHPSMEAVDIIWNKLCE